MKLFLPLVLVATLALQAQQVAPRLTGIEPDNAKPGDALTANGEYLDKANVADLYLTTGNKDYKVAMTEQTASAIKFKVPLNIPVGRYALMVLTAGKNPQLMEQPVKVTIEQ
jgi:nitrous oxidase accessory protein NosD